MDRLRRTWALVAALLVIFGVTLTVALVDTDDDGAKDSVAITIKVDGADADRERDEALVLGEAAQEYLTEEVGVPEGQVEDAVIGAPVEETNISELDAPLTSQDDSPESPTALDGSPLPLAAQDFPGCVTAFVRNMSSRGGVTPRVIVWHITAGPDRPGPSDNVALTGMSNNPANGVSWNFSIGSTDGVCYYNVPLSMKAWTAAAANPFTVNIEVINAGTEPYFVQGAGRAKLLSVTREISKRLGIPLQPAVVTDCRLIVAGIDQHKYLDDATTCAGGHNDADNGRPAAIAQVKELIAELAGPTKVKVTKRDRAACAAIVRYRGRKKGDDKEARRAARRPANVRRQKDRVRFVHERRHFCTSGGKARQKKA